MNADGTGQIRLTNNPANEISPAPAPDGARLAFVRQSTVPPVGAGDIYVMNVDGTNQVNITNRSTNEVMPSWSPNGAKIAFCQQS